LFGRSYHDYSLILKFIIYLPNSYTYNFIILLYYFKFLIYNDYVCDPISVKQAAKKLFEKYSYNKSELGQYEVSSMMRDVYTNINKCKN